MADRSTPLWLVYGERPGSAVVPFLIGEGESAPLRPLWSFKLPASVPHEIKGGETFVEACARELPCPLFAAQRSAEAVAQAVTDCDRMAERERGAAA